jgi:hypothetical protein
MFSTRKIVALSATVGMLGITGAQAMGAAAVMAKSPTLSAAARPAITICAGGSPSSSPHCRVYGGPNPK